VTGIIFRIHAAAQHCPVSFLAAAAASAIQRNVLLQADPALTAYSRDLITNAAKQLHAAKMAVFDERSGNLFVTELGRVASHFYIRCAFYYH
jgi:hypothetical protein